MNISILDFLKKIKHMEKIQNDEEVYNCSKFLLRKFELSKKLYRNYSSNKPVNNELNRTQYQLAYDIFFKIANLYCDVRFINAALKIADLKGLNDKKNSEIFIGEQVKRILK